MAPAIDPQSPPDVEVAIIGGSFAGISAALYLARARRRVAMFDHGLTRNRFAAHGHSFFGQDGRAPDAMRLAGRADLAAYPTVQVIEDQVTAITGQDGRFVVTGAVALTAAKVILAFGMRDVLPDLPGLAHCWGRTAIQCPYCHGYELADRPTGILMTGPSALHHALMLRDWTADLSLFTNGHAVSAEDRAATEARGVALVDGPVAGLRHSAGQVEAVALADGRAIAVSALYLVTRSEPSCDLAHQIDCAFDDGPQGPYVRVDALQETTVAGVWAAGDLCRPMYGAIFAAADGGRAGTAAHRALLLAR